MPVAGWVTGADMKTFFTRIVPLLAFSLIAGCRHLPTPTPPVAPAPLPTARAMEDEAYHQVRILTKTMMLVRQHYVDESKVSYSNLVSSALKGMLQSLDPFSQFMEPTTYKELQEETQGKFGGLGIQIGVKDNVLTVISPIDDTPAYRAGILASDKIVEINSNKTDSLDIREAISRLRGPPGTAVSIKILRGAEFKEFTLTREEIKIATIKGTRMLDESIGYIRITEFSAPTATALRKAVEELLAKGMKALILDQRNNPGGLLTSSIEVSELFLPKGTPIVSTRGRGDTRRQPTAHAGGSVRFTRFPMVVLVNGGSASAAEIVAGALHDNKRAILLGETTFGKGSVQNIIQIEDGTAARITTAHYYTPSGRRIHEKGIEPDISVPVPPEEWQQVQLKRLSLETPALLDPTFKAVDLDHVTDRQLDRAVDLLKGLLIFAHLQHDE